MGKRARAARKEKRLRAKRTTRQKNREIYESRKKAGQNKKSKRFVKSSQASHFNTTPKEVVVLQKKVGNKVVTIRRNAHGGPKCGNAGCIRCSSVARKAA